MLSKQDTKEVCNQIITNNNVYIAENKWLGYITVGENQLVLGLLIGGDTSVEMKNRVFFDVPIAVIFWDYINGMYDVDNMVFTSLPYFDNEINSQKKKINIPMCDKTINRFYETTTECYTGNDKTTFFTSKTGQNITFGYRLKDVLDLLGQINECKNASNENPSPMPNYSTICRHSILSLLFPFGVGELYWDGHSIYRHSLGCCKIKPSGHGNSAGGISLVCFVLYLFDFFLFMFDFVLFMFDVCFVYV